MARRKQNGCESEGAEDRARKPIHLPNGPHPETRIVALGRESIQEIGEDRPPSADEFVEICSASSKRRIAELRIASGRRPIALGR
jgi:ribosomal protein L1